MEIKFLSSIGYCNGVKRALAISRKIVNENRDKRIVFFGLPIHNEIVMKEFSENNVIFLKFSENNAIDLLNEINDDDVVIFSAHGHPKIYEEILNNRHIKFYDTTCPLIANAMSKMKNSDETFIYIGMNNHEEAIAFKSLNNGIFYDVNRPFDYSLVKSNKIKITFQSSLDSTLYENVINDLKAHFDEPDFSFVICNIIKNRNELLKNEEDNYSKILVLGSKSSSNTSRLFEIAKKTKKCESYFIENLDSLDEILFKNDDKILILTGTSCPEEFAIEVRDYLMSKTH